MLFALTALLALGVSSAAAAVKYPKLGEIAGPRAGESFGSLRSESVAVNDKNGHIYVAESGSEQGTPVPARVYDFNSAADTAPEVWEGANTAAGNFGERQVAVAVDNASGDVYVADSAHAVIDKFDQDGNLIASFGDSAPSPNGQLAGLETPAGSFSPPNFGSFGIAVDQATHDLYAIDAGHQAIDVFDPAGAYLKQITATPGELYGSGGAFTDGIAVNDKSGELLVSDSWDLKVYAFDLATGALKESFGDSEPTPDGRLSGLKTPAGSFGGEYTSVAANNSSGDLYVLDTSHEVVDRFDQTGKYEDQVTGTPRGVNPGVAVDQATGDLYVSDNASHTIKIFGPAAVLLPSVETKGPTAVGPTVATLNGSVNPEGKAVSDCHFEYVDAAHYQPAAFNPYAAGQSAPCAAVPGSGSAPVAVHADISGLEVGTAYHYRVVVANANGSESGADELLGTPPKPAIEAAAASEVTASSAKLSAEVNPEGAETTCLIEWGSTTEPGNPAVPYEHTKECDPFELGAGSAAVPVSLQLTGLGPNTTYHWRVLATNASGTTAGADHTFIFLTEQQLEGPCSNEAFRTGPSAALPDCRAYEMVTPVHKNAASVGNIILGLPTLLAADGSRLNASATQCFAASGSCIFRGIIGASFAFSRSATGWLTTPIEPPATQFAASTTWQANPNSGASLFTAPTAPAGEDDFYVRRADGTISHIGPLTPPQSGILGAAGVSGDQRSTTSDLSRIVFEQKTTQAIWPFDATTGQASAFSSTYEYADTDNAHPFLVGVSGARGSSDLISVCGTELPSRDGLLSTDGRTVFFTAVGSDAHHACFGSGENAGNELPADALYARIDGEGPAARTVALSASNCGAGEAAEEKACRTAPPGDADFQGASEDGTMAYFTSTRQLTDEASEDDKAGDSATQNGSCFATTGPNGCNLYLYERPQERPLTGNHLIAVSAGDTSSKGPQVQGVVAVSADGTHVYFLAKGKLTTEANEFGATAKAGADNLYLYDASEAKARFIATLPGTMLELKHSGNENSSLGSDVNVTPDGRYLLFTSVGAITPDTGPGGVPQVFRYDAQSGSLIRVSIGERGFGDNGNNPASAICQSGEFCPEGPAIASHINSFPSRRDPSMSDGGSRVFFSSPLALTPGALDQVQIGTGAFGPRYAQNVYQWEAPGSGGCAQPEGCVRLISGGRDISSANQVNCGESAGGGAAVCLLGTDTEGRNVFFSTTDQLVPTDTDTQTDYYDARVEGGFPETAGVTPCQSSEACHQGSTAEGPVSSPATPGFSGKEEGPKHAQCKKGQVKKHGKCVKRKSSKKHHGKKHHGKKSSHKGGGGK